MCGGEGSGKGPDWGDQKRMKFDEYFRIILKVFSDWCNYGSVEET